MTSLFSGDNDVRHEESYPTEEAGRKRTGSDEELLGVRQGRIRGRRAIRADKADYRRGRRAHDAMPLLHRTAYDRGAQGGRHRRAVDGSGNGRRGDARGRGGYAFDASLQGLGVLSFYTE